MTGKRICPNCGTERTDDAMGGLCPKCLARFSFFELEGDESASKLPEAAENTVKVEPKEDVEGEHPGMMIGRYKLLEQIGEGGFGVVYMAEQIEPLQRKVALKVIKAGMDTKAVVARFEAERQALALMDHPNIARVLDAGTTKAGRPYFVMELVRGVPITEFCDQKQFSTTERLELFMTVCHAVQHAHQKGIIHRDIKPSNVLVTLHDGKPVAKVIDFGVAKALGQKLTEKTLFTGFAQMIGTPAYMSPEQAELSGLDIDTRSDIYSLGVLLYELLTGVTPFDRETLAKAALDEVRRMIRETDPPKPSTRLQTLGEKITAVAKSRHTDGSKLIHFVRGDLDWIVMKCLEKDRARRYETANGLATDIERHLQHEPVKAAAPSAGYRAQKFIKKHRTAIVVISCMVLLLVGGTIVSTWQAVRATRAEREQTRLRQQAEEARESEEKLRVQAEESQRRATTAAEKSAQVARFLREMLEGVQPQVAMGRDSTMLREILDRTVERLDELRDQPEVEAELREVLAMVFLNLSEFAKAESNFQRALVLRRELHDQSREVALLLHWLGVVRLNACSRDSSVDQYGAFVGRDVEWMDGKVSQSELLGEAEDLLREGLEMQKEILGLEHHDVAMSLTSLGGVLTQKGAFADAEAVQREALAISEKVDGEGSQYAGAYRNNLAKTLAVEGKLTEAETLLRDAVRIGEQVHGDEHPNTVGFQQSLARVLQHQGRFAEAEELQREGLVSYAKLYGEDSRWVSFCLNELALTVENQGRLAEAETLQRRALAIETKTRGIETPEGVVLLGNLVRVLRLQTKPEEAEGPARQSLAIARRLYGSGHPMSIKSLETLAWVLWEQGHHREAEIACRELLPLQRGLGESGRQQLTGTLAILALMLLDQEKYDEALPFARECLSIRKEQMPDHWLTFNSESIVGGCLLGLKKYGEAEPLLVSGYEGMRKQEGAMPPFAVSRLAEAGARVVRLYEEIGEPVKADEWRQKLGGVDRAKD